MKPSTLAKKLPFVNRLSVILNNSNWNNTYKLAMLKLEVEKYLDSKKGFMELSKGGLRATYHAPTGEIMVYGQRKIKFCTTRELPIDQAKHALESAINKYKNLTSTN